jgi:hypothetical protein
MTEITALPAAAALDGTELLAALQGGNAVKVEVNALRDSIPASTYAELLAAITTAKTTGKPTDILINGTLSVAATIVVDAPNITLIGTGGDSSHDVGTQGAGARARLNWTGTAGGTVVRFTSISGASNQACTGGGMRNLYIGCGNSAAIGLQVLSWRKGVFADLHFDNPTTVAVDVNVVATLGEARDTQNNLFDRISCRCLETTGGTGGLLRLGGDATANTSLNIFTQMDCNFVNGTAYLFNNSDNNYLTRLRASRASGSGSAIVFNGSNAAAIECARSNIVTHLTSNGPLPIICRGTTTFTHPSIDNSVLLLDFDNGYSVPTIETGASAVWSDTRGLMARLGFIGMGVGDDITNVLAARTRLGNGSLHLVNGSQNHVRLSDAANSNVWGLSIDGSGNLRVLRITGTATFDLPPDLRVNAKAVTEGALNSGGTGFRVLRVPN